MEIRIEQKRQGQKTVIQVDGWLKAGGVAELERVSKVAPRPLVLDLTHLRMADEAGIRALRALADVGVELVGASPYIELLLK